MVMITVNICWVLLCQALLWVFYRYQSFKWICLWVRLAHIVLVIDTMETTMDWSCSFIKLSVWPQQGTWWFSVVHSQQIEAVLCSIHSCFPNNSSVQQLSIHLPKYYKFTFLAFYGSTWLLPSKYINPLRPPFMFFRF